MSDDLISRKYLLECAEYDNNGRLIIPYRYVKNAPTAFDKEKVMEKLKHCRDYYDINEQPKNPFDHWECADIRERKGKWMAYDDAIEIVEKGGLN